jgi:hypothetical protein
VASVVFLMVQHSVDSVVSLEDQVPLEGKLSVVVRTDFSVLMASLILWRMLASAWALRNRLWAVVSQVVHSYGNMILGAIYRLIKEVLVV